METAYAPKKPHGSIAEDIEHLGHETWLGIPKDIWLVLGIDLILISLRMRDVVTSNQFIGAKVMGTAALITAHFVIL
tara:strand:- start:174 stop:404 length:231 start_codon:yes stop_codon:yes gene_type:complete